MKCSEEVNEHRRQRWTAFRAQKQKEQVTVGGEEKH